MDRDLLTGLGALLAIPALVAGVNIARGVRDYYRAKEKLLVGEDIGLESGIGGRIAFRRYRAGKFGNYNSRKQGQAE